MWLICDVDVNIMTPHTHMRRRLFTEMKVINHWPEMFLASINHGLGVKCEANDNHFGIKLFKFVSNKRL